MVVYDNIGVHGTGREMNVEEFWVPARGSTTRNRAQSRALKSSGSTSSTTSSLVPGKAENQGALAEEAGISGSNQQSIQQKHNGTTRVRKNASVQQIKAHKSRRGVGKVTRSHQALSKQDSE